MPYRTNSDLPDNVRNVLPLLAQSVWRNVFNRVSRESGEESKARRQAWGAVRRAGWEKDEETGEWGKVEKHLTFRPPLPARNNAECGTRLRKQWNRGSIPETVIDGEDVRILLSSGEPMRLEKVKALAEFYESDKAVYAPDGRETDGGPTTDTIDWLLAGGTAGRCWTKRVLESVNRSQEGERTVAKDSRFRFNSKIVKFDESLGLVLGYGIICTEDGEQYFDLQEDHITDLSMFKASVDFMAGDRVLGDMHRKIEGGMVVFAWPMTAEIAKAFDIITKTTGLMLAVKPENDETLEKFRSGEYTGFSIGGEVINNGSEVVRR